MRFLLSVLFGLLAFSAVGHAGTCSFTQPCGGTDVCFNGFCVKPEGIPQTCGPNLPSCTDGKVCNAELHICVSQEISNLLSSAGSDFVNNLSSGSFDDLINKLSGLSGFDFSSGSWEGGDNDNGSLDDWINKLSGLSGFPSLSSMPNFEASGSWENHDGDHSGSDDDISGSWDWQSAYSNMKKCSKAEDCGAAAPGEAPWACMRNYCVPCAVCGQFSGSASGEGDHDDSWMDESDIRHQLEDLMSNGVNISAIASINMVNRSSIDNGDFDVSPNTMNFLPSDITSFTQIRFSRSGSDHEDANEDGGVVVLPGDTNVNIDEIFSNMTSSHFRVSQGSRLNIDNLNVDNNSSLSVVVDDSTESVSKALRLRGRLNLRGNYNNTDSSSGSSRVFRFPDDANNVEAADDSAVSISGRIRLAGQASNCSLVLENDVADAEAVAAEIAGDAFSAAGNITGSGRLRLRGAFNFTGQVLQAPVVMADANAALLLSSASVRAGNLTMEGGRLRIHTDGDAVVFTSINITQTDSAPEIEYRVKNVSDLINATIFRYQRHIASKSFKLILIDDEENTKTVIVSVTAAASHVRRLLATSSGCTANMGSSALTYNCPASTTTSSTPSTPPSGSNTGNNMSPASSVSASVAGVLSLLFSVWVMLF